MFWKLIVKSSCVPCPRWLLTTFVCFVACYRSGVWLSETTRLFSSLTQRPSCSSKHRVLQPQPWGHLRLTPNCPGDIIWAAGQPVTGRPNNWLCWNDAETNPAPGTSLSVEDVGKKTLHGGWVGYHKKTVLTRKLPSVLHLFLHCLLFHLSRTETQTDVSIHLQIHI